MKIIILTLAFLLLSNTVIADDNQDTYKLAMQQGCDSGSNASGNWTKQFQKDIDRYVKDAYYKSGWDDGFTVCKAQGDQINRAIDGALYH